ncbi:Ferric iron ABC transporter, ATP-binding protein [Minicystis rosea]|nr:Ferric iron ABC transporter, ATP-binding protein [Minicystis rosea]
MSGALDAHLVIAVGEGDRAFRVEADLALDAGVLVLFGPSGVGKTLTLQALAGLLHPVAGHIRVAGETLFDAARRVDVPAHARRVGFVPQQHALFPFLDVAGNVAFGLPRAERRGPRLTALLDELGLAQLASAKVASLSGGERQRVALARALAVDPRLLLLDEPFASIDQEGRAALRKMVRAVIDRRGVPAVLVTHDPEEAIALGDQLVRFTRGKTSAQGPPRALLARSDRVTIAGTIDGPIQPLGEGRALAKLRDAVIEGPAEALRGDRIDLDLSPVAKSDR